MFKEYGLMKRAMLLGLVLAIVFAWSTSSWAAIRIKRISFDPVGADSGTNRHLNKEYIVILNKGGKGVQMRGWKILDKHRDHVYRFRALFLGPGDTIRLRSGRGTNGAAACEVGTSCPEEAHYDFYWGLDDYVWGNNGDVARLKKPSGKLVDRCRYGSSATSPKRC